MLDHGGAAIPESRQLTELLKIGDVRDGEEDDDDEKDDVFSTDEDSGDRIELHLVLPEVEQQVQEAAVVRRQEGELQQVIG